MKASLGFVAVLGYFAIVAISPSARTALAALNAPPPEAAISENEQFGVELTFTDPVTLQVNIFRRGEPRVRLWGRSVKWRAADAPMRVNPPVTALIDDAGKHVVLFDPLGSRENGWVFLKEGGEAGAAWEQPRAVGARRDLVQEWVLSMNSMHFFAPPQRYCFWLGKAGEWFVYDLERSERIIVNESLGKELDAVLRKRALKKIHAHQRGETLIAAVHGKLASIIPGLSAPAGPPGFDTEMRKAYCLITQQRRTEDRPLVERLLSLRNVVREFSGFDDVLQHSWRSEEAAFGDRLLAAWDEKPPKIRWRAGHKIFERDAHLYEEAPPVFHGEIQGRIELPIPFPPNGGDLFIYVIPNEHAAGDWFREKDVIATRTTLSRFPDAMAKVMTRVEFDLETIPPGEYRLKTVWDRRAARVPRGEHWAEASPGDYESGESASFQIAAGQTLTNIVLYCTNRVGDATEYFAADELWKEKFGEIREEQAAWRNSRDDTVAFTASVDEWIQNSSGGGVRIKDISLIAAGAVHVQWESPVSTQALALRVQFMLAEKEGPARFEMQLSDKHGCKFSAIILGGGRYHTAYFRNWPRAEMRLAIRRPEKKGGWSLMALYALTNIAPRGMADWKAERLPQTKNIGPALIQLNGFDENWNPLLEFSNLAGEPVSPWRGGNYTLTDRYGNSGPATNAGVCLREPMLKFRGEFLQATNGIFETAEVLELTIPEIPAPGKHLPLAMAGAINDVTVRAIAVTGTGEFGYLDEEILDASEQITMVKPAGWRFRDSFEDVFVKSEGPVIDYMSGRRKRSPIYVVSKVPHVAILFRGLTREHAWHVEGITGIRQLGEYEAGKIYPPEFIPLRFESGATNVKVRIIVQKKRGLEWIVDRAGAEPRGTLP